MNTITKKLAVFEYTSWGNLPCLAGMRIVQEDGKDVSDLIRISEWQDVEFIPIPVEEVIPEILAGLQQEEDEENRRHVIAIANTQRKRQEFLAITHEN